MKPEESKKIQEAMDTVMSLSRQGIWAFYQKFVAAYIAKDNRITIPWLLDKGVTQIEIAKKLGIDSGDLSRDYGKKRSNKI